MLPSQIVFSFFHFLFSQVSPQNRSFFLPLLIISFAVQKLLHLIGSRLSILAFVAIAFGVLDMKSLPVPMS